MTTESHDEPPAHSSPSPSTRASAAPAVDAEQPPHPFAPGSIGRGLLLWVLVIVTVATTVVAAAGILVTQQLLLNTLDTRLVDLALVRSRATSGSSDGGSQEMFNGQPLGTVVLEPPGHVAQMSIRPGESVDDDQVAELASAMQSLPADGHPRSLIVELGDYRVVGLPRNNGGVVYVAQPMDTLNSTMLHMMLMGMGVCVIAIVAAAVSVRAVMMRALRPLTRLASTAQKVSRQQLGHGEVDLRTRVSARDADPSTDVGQVGYAFNHMLDNVGGALAARQASETKLRQFVADASHELRNPLAAIRGYSELLQRDADDFAEPTQHAMSRISSESSRMSSLVEDLLLLARLDADPSLDLAAVDASEVVINAISDARVADTTHNWRVSLPDEPVTVMADRFRLHQVVANLLANARTHTPAGTSVTAGVRIDGDEALISVTDDGPGFPEALREAAFERFARGDSSRARTSADGVEGTGLGLSIVAAVMAAHGGRASIDSRPGHTTVNLHLALAD